MPYKTRSTNNFNDQDKRISRDMLYNEIMLSVSHYGNLSFYDKAHILSLVKHKIKEQESNKNE